MAKEGEHTSQLSPEFRDVFYIADRIKQIDPEYYILFNKRNRRYQVHAGTGPDTLQLELPFDVLDCRALDYVRQTSVKRLRDYMDELDKYNRDKQAPLERPVL